METIIPQPNSDYFKLSARDATKVAWQLAAQGDVFNWQLFRMWTQAYGEIHAVSTRKVKKIRPGDQQMALV